ncbi:hypothetical protein B0H12DRAFT_64365 [Mycena haematopus]|nr:hypothetical protein B0H12DRAFT_64365 [Mycena haematopus]
MPADDETLTKRKQNRATSVVHAFPSLSRPQSIMRSWLVTGRGHRPLWEHMIQRSTRKCTIRTESVAVQALHWFCIGGPGRRVGNSPTSRHSRDKTSQGTFTYKTPLLNSCTHTLIFDPLRLREIAPYGGELEVMPSDVLRKGPKGNSSLGMESRREIIWGKLMIIENQILAMLIDGSIWTRSTVFLNSRVPAMCMLADI